MAGMWWTGVGLADIALSSGLDFVIGGLAAVAVLLVFVGMQRAINNRSASVATRLNDLGLVEPAPASGRLANITQRAIQRPHPVYTADGEGGARQGSYTQKLARDFAQADLKITVGEYLVFSGILASVGALVGFALPLGGHVVLGVILFLAGIYGPRIWVTRRKNKRMRAFNMQLADMIALMTGALRSGSGLFQAMEMAAHEGPAPAAQEFERVVREVGLGLTPEEALSNLVVRMESEDLVLLVTALNVSREAGGNLVEVMDTIASTIRDRSKLLAEVRVLTAQQQYSGYLIALLPVALSLMLAVINPNYMLGVFRTTTWCGWTMAGCSVSMILAGFFIIRRIVNIKV